MGTTHIKRVLTSAVAIPLLVLVIMKGGKLGFAFLVGLASVLGLLEYYAFFFRKGFKGLVGLKALGVVLCLSAVASFYNYDIQAGMVVLVPAFFSAAFICLGGCELHGSKASLLSTLVTGFVYIPFLLGHLVLIRGWDRGIVWTFFLLTVVFAGDTAAYYIGSAIGRHKLCPAISPGKTVEGACGGLIANVLIGVWFKASWLSELSWPVVIGLVIFMGIFGQIGDLFESMLKRSVDQKDSGGLLPGHGGVLDRIDGLIFATPVLYYFKTFFLGA